MSWAMCPLTIADVRELMMLVPQSEAGFELMGVNFQGLDALGDAVVIRDATTLLCAGGLLLAWPGVASGWLVVTRRGKAVPHRTCRAIQTFLVDRVAKHRLWRIEAMTRADMPDAAKLLGIYGFTYEGVRRQYFADRSHGLMYAWVREGAV